MIDSLGASVQLFIANLNATQNVVNHLNQEITSGVRVSVASDDPSAVQPILAIQSRIAWVTQVQTNLTSVKAEADSADSALQTAVTLMNSAISIAEQGGSTTATAQTMSAGAEQVKQILDQMVGIANTNVNGRYIFGGDASATAPYANTAAGVQQLSSAASTRVIENASGGQLNPLPTAQEIFDTQQSNGTPAANNVFASLTALEQALNSGDSKAVAATVTNLQQSQQQISSQLVTVGDAQTWIQQSTSDASSQLTSLQTQLSALRDTDMTAAITQLTTEQTAEQAAISAEAQVPRQSLFNYLG